MNPNDEWELRKSRVLKSVEDFIIHTIQGLQEDTFAERSTVFILNVTLREQLPIVGNEGMFETKEKVLPYRVESCTHPLCQPKTGCQRPACLQARKELETVRDFVRQQLGWYLRYRAKHSANSEETREAEMALAAHGLTLETE